MNKRYQVFISSTYSDLKDERSKVMQTIMSLDCIPAGMELFPAIDAEQFEFIKKIIDDCDYYVLIVGGRYGSLSDDGISYTEKEFNYALSKSIPVIAFIHENLEAIPLGKSELDTEKRTKLDEFRNKVSTGRLVQFWSSAEDLNGKVAVSLTKTIKTYPAIGWVRANLQTNSESLQEMNILRKELAELKEYKAKVDQEKNRDAALVSQSIAGLDEKITIEGTYSYSRDRQITKGNWNVCLSWQDIFSAISPFFIQPLNDDKAKVIISSALFKLSNSGSHTNYINTQDFQTIKLQLKALGLFDMRGAGTSNGSSALFWFLTEKGNQLMMETRTIKTAKL